jgi:hypothetical protein
MGIELNIWPVLGKLHYIMVFMDFHNGHVNLHNSHVNYIMVMWILQNGVVDFAK